MATRGFGKNFQQEVTCSICLEPFSDPVLLDCGHNFCKACVARWWEEFPSYTVCPRCPTVQPRSFRANIQLAKVAQLIKVLPQDASWYASHYKPLSYFCTAEEVLTCMRSRTHKRHKVMDVEEIAEMYKNSFLSLMEMLGKEKEKVLAHRLRTEERSRDFLSQIQEVKQKMLSEFQHLHLFLLEQERLKLSVVQKLEKVLAKTKNANMVSLFREVSSLDSNIQKLEKRGQLSSYGFLKDVGTIMQGWNRRIGCPVALPNVLINQFLHFCGLRAILQGAKSQLKDSLTSGYELQKANVTLDPETASPTLTISKDQKGLMWGIQQEGLLKGPERFDLSPCVLGADMFTAGRHYWEVHVSTKQEWAVGVAKQSVKRRGLSFLSPKEGIWAVGGRSGQYKVFDYTCFPLPWKGELKRVRVILNCIGGQLAFYDADTVVKVFVFSGAPFAGETLLPFFFLSGRGYLSLSP